MQSELQLEKSHLEAEMEKAKASFRREARNLFFVFVILALGSTLELWLKASSNFFIFVIALIVGPFGAAFLYIVIRVLMAWNEMSTLTRRWQHFVAVLDSNSASKRQG